MFPFHRQKLWKNILSNITFYEYLFSGFQVTRRGKWQDTVKLIGIFLQFFIVNAPEIYIQYVQSQSQRQFEKMFKLKANT
jgi:hypothetical protein